MDLSADDREMEAALGRLRPRATRLDRERVLMAAIRATERRRLSFWRAAAGAMAACLAVALTVRRSATPVERVVVVKESAPAVQHVSHPDQIPVVVAVNGMESRTEYSAALPDEMPAANDDSYLAIRQRLLRYGLAGVASPAFLQLAAAGKLPATASPPQRPIQLPDDVRSRSQTTEGPLLRLMNLFDSDARPVAAHKEAL